MTFFSFLNWVYKFGVFHIGTNATQYIHHIAAATDDDAATVGDAATGDDAVATGDDAATAGDDPATGDDAATVDDAATGDDVAADDDAVTGDDDNHPHFALQVKSIQGCTIFICA